MTVRVNETGSSSACTSTLRDLHRIFNHVLWQGGTDIGEPDLKLKRAEKPDKASVHMPRRPIKI
eukprot:scaffold40354_cov49-Prasinocladus_malaysianus.AAC.2